MSMALDGIRACAVCACLPHLLDFKRITHVRIAFYVLIFLDFCPDKPIDTLPNYNTYTQNRLHNKTKMLIVNQPCKNAGLSLLILFFALCKINCKLMELSLKQNNDKKRVVSMKTFSGRMSFPHGTDKNNG